MAGPVRRLPPATGDTLTLAWLVAAAAELRRGEETSARRAVQSALTAAQPSRSMRPFYDAGPPVRALLEELEADAGPQEEFLATVLERCRAADRWLGDTAGSSPGNELPGDPPTARELEVLAELRSPRTLAEIAERRSVSLNTIKTQTGSLYRKLGVQGRRQAVAAGRRLGLL